MKKILIVEDDTSIYNIYATELKIKGYDVENVTDGMKAMEAIKDQAPNLVLLDLMLPGKNGLEILQEMKENEETSGIKVVMLTNYGDDENVKKALEYGAEDFMLKYNIVPSELSAKVSLLLGEVSESAVTLKS